MKFERQKPDTTLLRPLLAKSVAKGLSQIFLEGQYADKVIEFTLRSSPKAGSRDRSFIAETTYEVVRNYRMYAEILGQEPRKEGDFWKLIGIHLVLRGQNLPDWRELEGLDATAIREKEAILRQERRFHASLPDWIDELGEKELGKQWEETANWLNKPAQVVLRTNRLKTTREQLQRDLIEEGVYTQPFGDGDALVLTERKNVFRTLAFKHGHFEVQDYSSQLVAPLLAPEPGMRVVDACAGGGGKSLHLAALMQNKGSLIALDTLSWKLDALKQRARRGGISNIDTRAIENNKVIKRLHGTADRLLLDVPCSGLGVLRRNPDSKWKLNPEMIDSLRKTQQDILQSYSAILKPGGRMVYATCSILPSENEEQVRLFLESEAGKSFQLLSDRRILPQDDGFDGFYMALLEKKQPAATAPTPAKTGKKTKST